MLLKIKIKWQRKVPFYSQPDPSYSLLVNYCKIFKTFLVINNAIRQRKLHLKFIIGTEIACPIVEQKQPITLIGCFLGFIKLQFPRILMMYIHQSALHHAVKPLGTSQFELKSAIGIRFPKVYVRFTQREKTFFITLTNPGTRKKMPKKTVSKLYWGVSQKLNHSVKIGEPRILPNIVPFVSLQLSIQPVASDVRKNICDNKNTPIEDTQYRFRNGTAFCFLAKVTPSLFSTIFFTL